MIFLALSLKSNKTIISIFLLSYISYIILILSKTQIYFLNILIKQFYPINFILPTVDGNFQSMEDQIDLMLP